MILYMEMNTDATYMKSIFYLILGDLYCSSIIEWIKSSFGFYSQKKILSKSKYFNFKQV